MKKTFPIIFLSVAIASTPGIAACGSSTTDNSTSLETKPTSESVPVVGGWTLNTDTKGKLSHEESNIFKAATTNTDRAYLTPVAHIGSQIADGSNHAFLCVDKKANAWCIITVYNNIYGTTKIIGECYLDPQNLSLSDNREPSELVGGWSVSIPESITLPSEAQKNFDKAMEATDSSSFDPVALLSTQVVAGTNYRFLCTGSSDSETCLYVVDIYTDFSGNSEITQSHEFSLIDYVGPN